MTQDRPTTTGHHVRLRQIVKRYGATTALGGVDLDVAPGQFLVLLGPSGSGKSTLLRCLAGIERLDGGTIHFGERTISDGYRHVAPDRRNLAMVFQDYALWPHLTALGNIGYALRRRHLGRSEATARAKDALERVGLGELAERYPHELSGGEQQRVGLARAIVARPELLLFDEPLSNLDADLRERMRIEISTITRDTGSTAVYITHDQSEAFALADQVGILNNGRLEQLGAPEEIYHRPATPFVARFTGIAGQLTGRALGRRGEHLVVQIGNNQMTCRAGEGIATGDTVTIFIRPAATTLTITEDATHPATLAGTIIDIAYRGRGYDHVIDYGGGTLTSVFDDNPWPRASTCAVRLAPDGCTAFPAASEPLPDSPGVELTTVRVGTEQPVPALSVLPSPLEVSRP